MSLKERLFAKQLSIKKFRSFKDVKINIGKYITVVSGVNGVGKSNILSLIASGSGVNKKSELGNNFQPEFTDFFNIDENEEYSNYDLSLDYITENNKQAVSKRLSFKNDIKSKRGIRIIPRTSKDSLHKTIAETSKFVKETYGVGPDARVEIPTIYLSLSRLYPLGESDNIKVEEVPSKSHLYEVAHEKYREWYNTIIPNSIKYDGKMTEIHKTVSARSSLNMSIVNTPVLSQSIGQDNIGNIVSALVDLYILSQNEDYKGAILCIDEVEVSLHPDTQIKLFELLYSLSKELQIQIIMSTHSLIILKEALRKQERHTKDDVSVVYLKSPTAPYPTKINSYNFLKADMFNNTSLIKPKVKIYFEDEAGKFIFSELLKAFKKIYRAACNDGLVDAMNHLEDANVDKLSMKIKNYSDIIEIEDNITYIITHSSCDELIKISESDKYFETVMFCLDGDARVEKKLQPQIREYLDKDVESGLNVRNLQINFICLPTFFAPESYLYRIIYSFCENPTKYMQFWRDLDQNESTCLYTVEKIQEWFSHLPRKFNNDDLKKIFNRNASDHENCANDNVWTFIEKSEIVTYYYFNYKTVNELLDFIENLVKIHKIVYSKMTSRIYTYD